MLNLKTNENGAVFDKIFKKQRLKFQKMKGTYFYGQHPLVKKSPPATDIIIIMNYLIRKMD